MDISTALLLKCSIDNDVLSLEVCVEFERMSYVGLSVFDFFLRPLINRIHVWVSKVSQYFVLAWDIHSLDSSMFRGKPTRG